MQKSSLPGGGVCPFKVTLFRGILSNDQVSASRPPLFMTTGSIFREVTSLIGWAETPQMDAIGEIVDPNQQNLFDANITENHEEFG